MTRFSLRASSAPALALGTLLLVAACTDGGRSEYARDGDTGAAAPATQLRPAEPLRDGTQPLVAPDSNRGAAGGRTGEPAMSGEPTGGGARGPLVGSPATRPATPPPR